jgi:hypothetical protein
MIFLLHACFIGFICCLYFWLCCVIALRRVDLCRQRRR